MRGQTSGRLIIAGIVAAGAASACGTGSLRVTKLASSMQRPANVALYVSVTDGKGQPVRDLDVDNFSVYEDGALLPPDKAQRALLERRLFGARFVLVLVDLSGPIVDAEDLPDLANAVGKFSEELINAGQEVAVSAFDGEDEVAPFFGFGASAAQAAKSIADLRKFRPRNRKTNLNGAVFQGVRTVEEQLQSSNAPQKAGALVVFTDHGNLSPSVSAENMLQALHDSPVEVYVIGVGAQINRQELSAIGRNGVFLSNKPKVFKQGFQDVAHRLTSVTDGKYVFAYCTPKRKGDHKLDLEVTSPNDKGRISLSFSAAGFKSGCSPEKRPTFAGAEDDEGDKGEKEGVGDAPAADAPASKPALPASDDQ